MIDDWEKEIAKALDVQNANERLDATHLWDYYPPNAPATEEELAMAHWHLGFSLDPHYKRFLSHANGWRCFMENVDLFGTEELRGGPPMQEALEMVDVIGDAMEDPHFTRTELLPIGYSKTRRDMFLLHKPDSSKPGAVIWWMGNDLERYPNFDEFFLAIVDNNKLSVELDWQKLQDQQNPNRPEGVKQLPTKAGGARRSLLDVVFRRNKP